jgi:hypothetical protein
MQEIIDEILQLDSLIGFKKLPASMNPLDHYEFTFNFDLATEEQMELVNRLLNNQSFFGWTIVLK